MYIFDLTFLIKVGVEIKIFLIDNGQEKMYISPSVTIGDPVAHRVTQILL